MKKIILYCTTILSTIILANCSESPTTAAEQLHAQACSEKPTTSNDPWHINNLYNCRSQELFIPYQLWTGAKWHGDKTAECMHPANNHSLLEQPSHAYGKGSIIIKGPLTWQDPSTGESMQVWERTHTGLNSRRYYTCHSRGIGIVHNVKKPDRNYLKGLCRAPGGHGWKVGRQRTCIKTTVEIEQILLDTEKRLASIDVNYWFRDKLLYRYTYTRNKGETKVFNYPQD